MLTERVAKHFDRDVRERGERYAVDGSMGRLTVRGDVARAVVYGTDEYELRIARRDEGKGWRLDVACSCRYAADNNDHCKHVWAMLRAGEAKLEKAWGTPPKLVWTYGCDDEDFSFEPDDDLDDGSEDEDGADEIVMVRPIVTPKEIEKAPIAVLRAEIKRLEQLERQQRAKPREPEKPQIPAWKRMLEETRAYVRNAGTFSPATRGKKEIVIDRVWYVIDAERSRAARAIIVELMRESGARGVPALPSGGVPLESLRKMTLTAKDVEKILDDKDREIAAMLVGAGRPNNEYGTYGRYGYSDPSATLWQLDMRMMRLLMPKVLATGRLLIRKEGGRTLEPATWNGDEAWDLAIEVVKQAGSGNRHEARPVLRRGDTRVALCEAEAIIDGDPGMVLHKEELAPLRVVGGEAGGMLVWAQHFVRRGSAVVEPGELGELIGALAERGVHLPVVWPENWGARRVVGVTPKPTLVLRTAEQSGRSLSAGLLDAQVRFVYEGATVDAGTGRYVSSQLEGTEAAMVERDVEAEKRAVERMIALGGKHDMYEQRLSVPVKLVPRMAAGLLSEGWTVLGDTHAYRTPGAVSVRVSSGIDWFDLEGGVEFGGDGKASAAIGDVLAALAKGEKFVKLGDGSLGLLPEEWLAKHGRWLALGRVEGEGVRFAKAQLTLVDALMAAMPEATCDAQVMAARKKLKAFEGIRARMEPKGFRGTLRPYQREGLGWLHFLSKFGLGGCLADDMGLGKTVQLLAHMAERRAAKEKGSWLVVAPKTLVFNWAREAERFTPGLKIVDHTGLQRGKSVESFKDADLVLTTYATMRMDIELLRKVEFACVVLDEAQAIKNDGSQGAKAARLLRARRRIALTGTPMENRLEDLWSIFEFLNPGMLGSSSAFKEAARSGGNVAAGSGTNTADGTSDGSGAGMEVLRRALRPFLLRRTKAKVAPDLPARSEQTVRCELEGEQRSLYDGLRAHYREQLLGRVERDGMNKSKMHVLEALLRLRQAACHTALVSSGMIEPKGLVGGKQKKEKKGAENTKKSDVASASGESAKVTTLVEMLEELAQEGHKALVFSQFTSLLALVKTELDRKKIVYEELDGSTSSKEREIRVDRFQKVAVKDGGRGVFLISLKAGGVGLNLTAAGYVFLLDPWWNPAVEAQAIDRTHRIGQDKSVIAYRLIATGTVEERILELQQSKRELAQAIVSESAGPLTAMTREDLEWLLS